MLYCVEMSAKSGASADRMGQVPHSKSVGYAGFAAEQSRLEAGNEQKDSKNTYLFTQAEKGRRQFDRSSSTYCGPCRKIGESRFYPTGVLVFIL